VTQTPVLEIDGQTVTVADRALIDRRRHDRGLACLLISHDFGVVADICDRVAVMYAGRIVKTAPAAGLSDAPAHAYSQAQVSAIPLPDPANPPPSNPGALPPWSAAG
jgi:peptide/nickel transport system permease protein